MPGRAGTLNLFYKALKLVVHTHNDDGRYAIDAHAQPTALTGLKVYKNNSCHDETVRLHLHPHPSPGSRMVSYACAQQHARTRTVYRECHVFSILPAISHMCHHVAY